MILKKSTFRFTKVRGEAAEITRRIGEGLGGFNRSKIGPAGFEPLVIQLRDSAGELRGGLQATSGWGWLFVDRLWVDEKIRDQGLGGRLMKRAEAEAKRRRCIGVELVTFGFQAPEFYKKLGYQVVGRVDDYVKGHARYWMNKRLLPKRAI